jgi:peptidoglycan/xylan/chitin deacetylase (PgdA/CDA1 family)
MQTGEKTPPRRVALTFDDGPAVWTEPILDVLAAHRVRATFFVIGSLVGQRAALVQRIVAEGHEVGNHSWSHPRLASECDDGRVHEELARTNEVLHEVLGFRPTRFRAPRYDVDDRVRAIAATLGLVHTRGDVAPPDYDARATAAFIATFVLQRVEPGNVIGLHDGVPPAKLNSGASRAATVGAVQTIVQRLRERDVELVTASELLAQ